MSATREVVDRKIGYFYLLRSRLDAIVVQKDAMVAETIRREMDLIDLSNKTDIYSDALSVLEKRPEPELASMPLRNTTNTNKRKRKIEGEPDVFLPAKTAKKTQVVPRLTRSSSKRSNFKLFGLLEARSSNLTLPALLIYYHPHATSRYDSMGKSALAIIDQRDIEKARIADAQANIVQLDSALQAEEAILDDGIKEMNTLINKAEKELQEVEARKARTERTIEKKTAEANEVLGKIEMYVGKEAMAGWRDELAQKEKTKPTLPPGMHGVKGDAIKGYIAGPMVPSQDGDSLVPVGGPSRRGGGARDRVPGPSEIGTG
ncbi:hypothetical protein B0H11DRAFT_2357629 [Mycena galericulata]|nr:hypothetical protein B0H11DRAFT_2357629 [Mycena galericulata]